MLPYSKPVRISRFVLYAVLSIVAFLYTYPFLWMVSGSFKKPGEFYEQGLRLVVDNPNWQNFLSVWNTVGFDIYFRNTVVVAVVTTLLVLLFTSMAGYVIARHEFPGRRLVVGCLLVTIFLPRGYTIVPIFELIKDLGLLNTLWAVILVSTGTSMVFNTFLFAGYFLTLPKELEEAALLDGANLPQIYGRVAIPFARPMIATVALFEFIEHWNSFFIPLVFTLGRPDLRTLAVGMYAFVGQHHTQWTLICAAATISLLPIAILFMILQRQIIDGIAGAIHG
ncbi:MAG: carbohydrate ABC transporter permease [Anaerolineae bacterium]